MKNQSRYPWAELWNRSVLWSTVSLKPSNLRKEVILSAWNDIKRHSASVYCYCCQYGNRGAGQRERSTGEFSSTETGSFRCLQSHDLCSLLLCWDLRQIMACKETAFHFSLPVCAVLQQMHAAVQVCSVNGKPSPLIKPPVRVLSLIWLHHDRQQSCLTEMRFFHPQL